MRLYENEAKQLFAEKGIPVPRQYGVIHSAVELDGLNAHYPLILKALVLVGGRGKRRCEPLSYHALVKLFERHCERLGIRAPWVTPHALRHTHATKLWEGGMRELALMKRLGHTSPESTRIYTQVSDPTVVAEYRMALGEEGLE